MQCFLKNRGVQCIRASGLQYMERCRMRHPAQLSNGSIKKARCHKTKRPNTCAQVDLAGSERVHKTQTGGQTLVEAKHINVSLFFLEMVIVALRERGTKGRRALLPLDVLTRHYHSRSNAP